MLTKEEAIKQIKDLAPTNIESYKYDNEGIHILADDILLECVDPEIKAAWLEIENRVGFWYS